MSRGLAPALSAARAAATRGPVQLVTLVARRGSAPQEPGALMAVDATGRVAGTVGGGKLEAWAVATAQGRLDAPAGLVRVNLQRDLGMTCGGEVTLLLEPLQAQGWLGDAVAALTLGQAVAVSTPLDGGAPHLERARDTLDDPEAIRVDPSAVWRRWDPAAGWSIHVFGAGHVAQALTRVLLTLDCRLTVVDPRAEWLERLPHDPLLTRICTAAPDEHVAAAPQAGYVVVMTQGHATDVPVLRAALQRPFPYVGVLGSAVKAQRLRRELLDAGLPADRVAALRCPIGLPLGRSTPPEIAISVAAQLITARDAGRTPRQSARPDAP